MVGYDDHTIDHYTGRVRKTNPPKGKRKRELIQKQIDHLYEEIRKLDAYPEDDLPDGSIISFDKTFGLHINVYNYAAIKVEGLWYLTGTKSPKAYTWDELVTWFTAEGAAYNLRLVTKTEKFGDL